MQKSLRWIFLIIIIISGSSFFTQIEKEAIGDDQISMIEDGVDHLRDILERNVGKVDTDDDRISDTYRSEAQVIDSMIIFESFDSLPKGDFYQGFPISSKLARLPVIQLAIPRQDLHDILSNDESILLIEENRPLRPYLAYSTEQLGVRSPMWDIGYAGSPDQSIAIVDSGIDFTHTAFKNKIIASYNALDNNATLAIDTDGHGTHVASIAAGKYVNNTGFYSVTTNGTMPSDGSIFYDITVPNVVSTTEINVKLDWGDPGNDTFAVGNGLIQIIKNNALFDEISSSAGYIDQNFTLTSGDYYIAFGNDGGAEGQPYEGVALIPVNGETSAAVDPVPPYYGVAYQSSIVAVKVLDSLGNGDTSDFANAIDWVINNREAYNISVINLSLGIDVVSATIDSLIADLANNGIIPVIAAGNHGNSKSGIFSPASAPESIAVGALNRVNELTYYSSYGDASTNNKAMKPDVIAPGGSYASVDLGFDTSYEDGFGAIIAADANDIGVAVVPNDLRANQGTSMAAPHISGLASILVQKYRESHDWNWNNNQQVLDIKRAILAGTFEISEIGLVREEPPGTNHGSDEPSLDRNQKDYYEGWGAVDAQAVFGVLNSTLEINNSIQLEFDHDNPLGRHSYAFVIDANINTNYVISLDLNPGADADIVLFEANIGPDGSYGSDYGDLTVIKTSTNANGEDEILEYQPSKAKKVIVSVRLVDSLNTDDIMTLTLTEGELIPQIQILSPLPNTQTTNTSVKVEYSATIGDVSATLNGDNLGFIISGYVLENLSVDSYILILTLTDPNGVNVSDQVSFDIIGLTSSTSSSTVQSSTSDSTSSQSSTEESTTSDLETLDSSSNEPEASILSFVSLNPVLVILAVFVPVYIRMRNKSSR